jgi:hypothetical protein
MLQASSKNKSTPEVMLGPHVSAHALPKAAQVMLHGTVARVHAETTAVVEHCPAEQPSFDGHDWQAKPAAPHALSMVPFRHAPLLQHPEQLLGPHPPLDEPLEEPPEEPDEEPLEEPPEDPDEEPLEELPEEPDEEPLDVELPESASSGEVPESRLPIELLVPLHAEKTATRTATLRPAEVGMITNVRFVSIGSSSAGSTHRGSSGLARTISPASMEEVLRWALTLV